jgi:hypothetical protein
MCEIPSFYFISRQKVNCLSSKKCPLYKAVNLAHGEVIVTRDTETGDPARLYAQVDGRWVKKWAVRKIIFCTGLTRAAKAGQQSIVAARRADEPAQFQQLAGVAPLLSL